MRKSTRLKLTSTIVVLLAIPTSGQQNWKYVVTGDSAGKEVKVYYRRPRRYTNNISRFQLKLRSTKAVSILVAEFDCHTEQFRTIQKTVLRGSEKTVNTKPEPWEAVPIDDFRAPLFREICGRPIGAEK